MDTKSLHCKHPKKMKSSKDNHEVFVLPPDLLKKLGISIGNINGSHVIPADANASPSTAIINNEHIENVPTSNCSQKPSDTSILETASLMKKSVFLSPTFVSTIANAISGEVEISSKNITADSVAVTELVQPQDSVFEPADIIEVANLLCDSNDIQEGCLKVDQYNIALNEERTCHSNINQENQCLPLDGNEKQVVDINMTFDENRSELESKVNNGLDDDQSFKSDNNFELTLSSTVTDSACISSNEDPYIPTPKVSKIHIISEETIPLSKLREIKRLQSLNGKKLTPITVQSIIDTKVNIGNRNFGLQSIMESNSTVPLENSEILHSELDQLKSGENTNQSNLISMYSNELIETTAVPILVSSKQVEEARTDITSNMIENVNLLDDERSLKDTSTNTTLDFNEDNNAKSIGDCELNDQNKISEDDISPVANATVNGFDTGEVVMFDVDKSVNISNGNMDEGTEPTIEHIKNYRFAENEHKFIMDNAEKVNPIQEATGIKEQSTVKEKMKQKVSPIQEATGIEEHNIVKEKMKQTVSPIQEATGIEEQSTDKEKMKQKVSPIQEATGIKEQSMVKEKMKQKVSAIQEATGIKEQSTVKEKMKRKISAIQEATGIKEQSTVKEKMKQKVSPIQEATGIKEQSMVKEKMKQKVSPIQEATGIKEQSIVKEKMKQKVSPIQEATGIKEQSTVKEKMKRKVSPIQEATGIAEHDTAKDNIKPKSNSKQSSNSKNTLDNNSGLQILTENKISSKNVEDKSLEHDELTTILNATKKLANSVTDIKVDKVKEIAAYLRKFSHIYTDKKKTKTALSNDITKKETINSNTNTIESKLCIQGVEKPGGNVDREHTGECKVLKTYARRNPPKASKLSTHILHKKETCNTVDELNLDLDAVNISTTCEMQEFCLCNDFGRLAYYDCDKLYEHIHFWHHHTANCELDLIFAIYSDEAVISNSESGLEKEEKTEETIEAYNVCWNIFQSEFSENVDNSDTELIGHNYVIDELKDACPGESSQVLVLNHVAQKVDEGIVYKTHDEVRMENNSNSDIILETIDHDMVDAAESKNSDSITNIEKPLNTDINDNNSAAGNEHINTDLGSSQPKLTPTTASKTGSSELSNVLDKTYLEDCDAKDKTYQRRQSSSHENKLSSMKVKLDSSKTINKTAAKRSLSGKTTLGSEPSCKKSVKCGLCNNIFSGEEWENHVANQHHLIAWRAGGSIKLDDPELLHKLKDRLKTLGVLECSLCNMQIKKFSRFMEHIKYCIRNKLSNADKKPDKPPRKSRTALDENFTCGVCQRTVLSSKWLEHIGSIHDYLAWKQGQDALNLHNESEVWQHLQNIIRLDGSLTCYKCGLQRSRVKTYQAHIKTCDGSRVCLDESSVSVDLNSSSIPENKTAEASTVKCGVCQQDVAHSDWIEHISKEHNYLAWQEGETPLVLEEEEAVWNHLQQFIRQNGGLTCHKCGLVRKRVKLYLTHIEMCDGTNSQIDNSSNNISLNTITDFNTTAKSTDEWYEVPIEKEERKVVKCGVCSEEVPILEWIQHIGKEHDYLAWQDGATPLDVENELEVKVHLLEVSRQGGGLVCNKCEKRLKYPKTFQMHIKECTGPTASPESKLDTSTPSWIEILSNNKIKDEILTCGVCAMQIESEKWINHIEAKHQYLAWAEGHPPLNFEDPVMVQRHLNDVSKIVGGLTCMKCGVKRKYVKSYLLHVDSCQGKLNTGELSFALMSKDVVECAICAATMDPKHWRAHSMAEHYNIAWVVGDNPIEINNPYAVESYLKEYMHAHNKLVCKVCKISRVSFVGFYAHIIVCGKTEKETEIYKTVCDICNNKYLRIYKNQHMTMHREKEYAKERKLLAAKEQALKKEAEGPVDIILKGRRKAAEKAKNVIEKYKNNFHDGNYHCSKCGFNTEIEKELSDHVCVDDKWGDATDSDESVKLENCSGDESDESDIDSNVSDEEREALEHAPNKKKKHSDSSSAKICRLPYQISNLSTYMKRSTEGFIDTYLTDEDLFPLWHNCELEEVPESEVMYYMPPVEESCKVRFDDDQDWMTFNRLESSRVKDTMVLFLGASIQCMSWVPAAADQERAAREPQYLAVVSHRKADAPRHAWDTTLSESGLIQLWDCGNLIATTPKFALGIAHDFGTVWAIDWCPSGAKDVFALEPASGNVHRLGLMAAACSNGLAYIFVVPYPTSITEKEKPFYKLKPVVELRLTSNESRRIYQASAIKWSIQKGHSHVVVGYSDGTTAYYDLNGESPLLKSTENNLTVLYPYHDERVQNSCIEDVDLYPSGAGAARAGGALCVGSAGGAGGGALQSHVAAARVLYPPHWPAALLAGDDCLVNQSINELEWWGGGRRLGGARGAAGCAWCGRVCAAALPLLRLMRVHPCFPDVHKQVIARIMMIPFGGKRKRQNDELAMIVEPITYSDAVKKYGIEFKQITARDRTTQQKLSATPRDAYPERFPLSDVAAIKFCPTFKQHHKLALAMHAGLIFIINV